MDAKQAFVSRAEALWNVAHCWLVNTCYWGASRCNRNVGKSVPVCTASHPKDFSLYPHRCDRNVASLCCGPLRYTLWTTALARRCAWRDGCDNCWAYLSAAYGQHVNAAIWAACGEKCVWGVWGCKVLTELEYVDLRQLKCKLHWNMWTYVSLSVSYTGICWHMSV